MAGEKVINTVETVAKTTGFDQAEREAIGLDSALDGVSISSDKVEKASLSVEKSLDRMSMRLDPLAKAYRDLAAAQDLHAKNVAQGGDFEKSANLVAIAQDRVAGAMRKTGTAANDNAQGFKLAGHQVQNLTFQLNDLATQIASGGGIFRPLIQQGGQVLQIFQQGEGGLRGAISGLAASFLRLGPAAIAGFGAAGIAGAVGLAANALSNFQEQIRKSEAAVRALTDSSQQANRVLAGASEAAQGSKLLGEDLQQTRLQAEALADQLGRFNPQQFTQGVANIAASMGDSREEMQKTVAAINGLGDRMSITSADAKRLASQFPELAAVLAKTFNTTPQGLLRLPDDLKVSTVRLRELIGEAGKAGPAVGGVRELGDAFGALTASIDKLLGLSTAWDFFWKNVAKGAGIAADAINKWSGATEAAPSAPSAGEAPPPSRVMSQSQQDAYYGRPAGAPSDPTEEYWKRNVGAGGQVTYDPPSGKETATNTSETADNTQKIADSAWDGWQKQAQADRSKIRALDSVDVTASDLTDGSKRYWVDSAGIMRESLTIQRDIAKNTRDTVAASSRLVNSQAQAFVDSVARGGDWGETMHDLVSGGGGRGQFSGATRNELLAMPPALYSRAKSNPFAALDEQLDDTAAAAETAADATNKVSNALSDLSSLGAPIESKIDTLRGLQETALSRPYRPDPYAEKNPEFFYSGERIFKESQDKIYEGLQSQIEKLEGLQAALGTLVGQNDRLPQALVDALIASGFGDIAQQIIAAFRSQDAPSATPNPTAVQATGPNNNFLAGFKPSYARGWSAV